MLDIADFIVEKGGDPNKIRESQRRRYAPEDAIDQVISLYESHRKSTFYTTPSEASMVISDPYSEI